MKRQIFISHASSDKAVVQRLYNLLMKTLHFKRGAIVCTSVEGGGLTNGMNYTKEIPKLLASVELSIYVMTENFLESSDCMFELEMGTRKCKKNFYFCSFDYRLLPTCLRVITCSRLDWEGLTSLREVVEGLFSCEIADCEWFLFARDVMIAARGEVPAPQDDCFRIPPQLETAKVKTLPMQETSFIDLRDGCNWPDNFQEVPRPSGQHRAVERIEGVDSMPEIDLGRNTSSVEAYYYD